MTQPKVSIIVPVYNVEMYFERCITSLVNQTLEDIEIILVDDGSPGISPQLCDEAAAKDSRIKVIHKENAGAGYARNSGLAIAKGKYIGFVDSDDFVDKNMYEILYNTAEKYSSQLVMSGVVFVGGNIFSEDGETKTTEYFTEDTQFETEQELKGLRLGIVGSLPGEEDDSRYGMSVWKNLFRKDVIEENNLAFVSEREMFSEDALFMIDYVSCISRATGIRDALYNYCRNGDSISKGYRKDRFEKGIVFIKNVAQRHSKDIPYEEYSLYTDRFWQSFCRVVCSQEIMHAAEKGIKYSALKERLRVICTSPETIKVLKTYPLKKLPLKQMLFAYAMKYKLYYLMVKMVSLRNR